MTSWKFNPPPGWSQQPEGWVPPPGWAPDPSWPPAPAGWEFWVPASTPPASTPPASTSGTGAAPAPATGAGPGPSVHEAPTPLAVTAGHASGPPAGHTTSGPPQPTSAPPTSAPPGTYPPGTYPPGTYPPGPYPPRLAQPPASGPTVPAFHRWWAFAVLAVVVLLIGCVGGGSVAMLVNAGGETPTLPGPAPTTGPAPDDGGGAATGALPPGQQRSGQGPAIVPLMLPSGAFHMLTLTYEGDDFFVIRLVDPQGGPVNSLASGRGPATGTYPVELGSFEVPTAVDMADGEGRWTLQLRDINEAPLWPAQSTGNGDMVLRVDPAVAVEEPELLGRHDGDANFIVWAYGTTATGDRLLFNAIGEHDGSSGDRLLPADALILMVRANGEWQILPA